MRWRCTIALGAMLGGLAACPRPQRGSPTGAAVVAGTDASATPADARPTPVDDAGVVDANPGFVIGPVTADVVTPAPAPTCAPPRRLSRTMQPIVGVRFCTSGGSEVSLTTGELVLSRDGRASWTWTSHTPQPTPSGESPWRDAGTSTVSGCWRERRGTLELDSGAGWTSVAIERDGGQPLLRTVQLAYHVCPT